MGYVYICICLYAYIDNHRFKIWTLRQLYFSHVLFTAKIMTKEGWKKLKIAESDSDTEVVEVSPIVRTEIVYEDTKEIIEEELELKWGQIYPMLVKRKVPEAGLEDLALYGNILRSGITKIATRPDIFPCAEIIGWMFLKYT